MAIQASAMRLTLLWAAVALLTACSDDKMMGTGGSSNMCGAGGGAAGTAAGGDSCDGVTGPCLTNQGSTQFEDVRVQESGIANLLTDVLRTVGGQAAAESIDIAFVNGGALRAGTNSGDPDFVWSSETARIGSTFGPGPITEEEIRGWWPFRDDTVVMTLTGAQIKRALESGVRTWADDAGLNFGPDFMADKGGELLHASGLSYEVRCAGSTRVVIGPADCDPFMDTCMYQNADQANSISEISVGGSTIFDADAGGWQSGGDTQTFRVIMNSFIAGGRDNHLDFKEGTDQKTIALADWNFADALVEFLQTNSPYTLDGSQGRIQVSGAVGGTACNLPSTCIPAHRNHPNCCHL